MRTFPVVRSAGPAGAFICIFLVALLGVGSASAQTTHTVCPSTNPGAPCDYESPEAALVDTGAVLAGDTLEILTDTYVLGSTLAVDRSLIINGNGLVLDAGGSLRGINVTGASTIAEINSLAVINGQALGADGGAIEVSDGATLTLNDAVIQDSAATSGGGIANINSILTISGSAITGNSAENSGGGVLTSGLIAATGTPATTLIVDTTIDANRAGFQGGGLATLNGATTNAWRNTISQNSVVAAGQDLSFSPSGTSNSCGAGSSEALGQTFVAGVEALTAFSLWVRRSGGSLAGDVIVQGRLREGPGGPIIATAETLFPANLETGSSFDLKFDLEVPVALSAGATYAIEINNNLDAYTAFQSDAAYAGGGSYGCGSTAVSADPDRAFTTEGGSLGFGAGVFTIGTADLESQFNIRNSTISGNIGDGGYAGAPGGFLNINLGTIVDNSGNGLTALVGSQVAFARSIVARNAAFDCSAAAGVVASGGFNLIGDTSDCNLTPGATDLFGDAGSPLDPQIGSLEDNGGPTLTHALLAGSPAIDSADADVDCGGVTVDQRGATRPQGAACDIGAFETGLAPATLQSLIDAAAPGATIDLPDGTYAERITLGDGKTLRGSGPANVIIDASGRGGPAVVATGDFTIEGIRITGGDNVDNGGAIVSGFGFDITLDNVELIANRSGGDGGAVYIPGGSLDGTNLLFRDNVAGGNGGSIYAGGTVNLQGLTIENPGVTGNSANAGGAIWVPLSGDLTIGTASCTGAPTAVTELSNVIRQTNAVGAGGAIFSLGRLQIADATIGNNLADFGGAIATDVGNTLIECSVIAANIATGTFGGGAVASQADATLSLDRTLVQGNQSTAANSAGGGILNQGAATLIDSTLAQNRSAQGGGLFNLPGAVAVISGVSFTDNTVTGLSPGQGGGVGGLGSFDILNSTFSANQADGAGGAIYVSSANARINNVSFVDNAAGLEAGAIFADPATAVVSFSNSLFSGNIGSAATPCGGLASAGFNLFDVAECPPAATDIEADPLIAPLALGGGSTPTHDLQAGSAALDTGGPVPSSFPETTSFAELATNGSTVEDGGAILLAQGTFQAGSAYLPDTIDVTRSFSARFDFLMTPDADGDAADGITFTVTDDPSILGSAGGFLGIGVIDTDIIEPGNQPGGIVDGVSVEFDTWVNGAAEGANDPGAVDHIGININGSLSSIASFAFPGHGVLSDGNIWTAWIDYDPGENVLEVRAANDGIRPASPAVAASVDIAALTGPQAFVGFTGATGSSDISGEHRILGIDIRSEGACETIDQLGVTRPQAVGCDIGAIERAGIPASIQNAALSASPAISEPGVVTVPIIDIPIERLTGGAFNAPSSAPLSSFPLSSFPLSSLDLRASPLSSFPLSSFPLSSFDVAGAPLSSFPLSSFPLSSLPLLTIPGGWSAVLADIPSLAGAPVQTVTLEDVLTAGDAPAGALDGITLGSLAISESPLSSLSITGLALGDATNVAVLDSWFANAGTSSDICSELAGQGFSDCSDADTLVSLQIKSAPLSSLPLSSLPLSSFPLSSFPLSSFPLSSFPLSSFPLSSFPLSSFPLSSLPLSSLPLSSFPLSSLDLLAAPLSSFPLSSFPLSSLPLSSLEVDGQSFCEFFDAAAGSTQPGCAALRVDPETDGLADLIAALGATGNDTLASTPLSSFPLSSFDIASVPLSSLPLSSFELESAPLSSLQLEDFDGCTIIDGSADCSSVAGLSGTSTLLDVAGVYGSLAASPLSSLPLSSLPLSSLPLSSFPLSSLEVNGAPLSSLPLSSFDLVSSPLSSLPLSSLPLSSLDATVDCSDCTTVGDAAVAGSIILSTPLSSLFADSDFLNLSLGDLYGAFSLELLFGVDTLGEIEDVGNLTLGQLLIALILRSDFPWETIPLAQLDVQSFAADNLVSFQTDFSIEGNDLEPITVAVTLSDRFAFVPGSATFTTQPQFSTTATTSAIADPVITDNGDGTQTLGFGNLLPNGFSDNFVQFDTVAPLAIGDYFARADVGIGPAAPVSADAAAGAVSVIPSALTESTDIGSPIPIDFDVLYLGHIDVAGDIDYFRIPPAPEGSRVSVFMANPAGDNDLFLYQPATTATELVGQQFESAPLDSLPFEDDGVDYGANKTEEPDTLEDMNIAGLPLSSLSTNRGDSDEEVSAIAGESNPFILQVSGYSGAASTEPFSIRSRVVAEVPVAACTSREWPASIPAGREFVPAGTWTAETNAVFLVNWNRLAAIDGADAANAALDAVNALVTAPGVASGVVVDVNDIPGVDYGPWDTDPCDVDAANRIVASIVAYLEQQRVQSPNLSYVTVVGSDEVIPFQRKPDETAIANESTFAGEFSDNAMFGALVSRHFLSDDTYGDIDPIPWFDRFLHVPELAVGRLVESAADIQKAATDYVLSGGVLTPFSSLSAGYDFVSDASEDINDTFSAYGLDTTGLIDQPGVDPSLAWDRESFLETAGLDEPARPVSDVVSFNMHFDFDEALPSSGDAAGNYSDNLITVSDFDGNDLTGRLFFTVGCHSGTSVADISVAGDGLSQDWPQKLNELGAVYVAQAAYGLGDTVALALTERLLANFARNLNGTFTAGQAHSFAKQSYFRDLGLYGEYDYKAMQASVLFGLPMYRVVTPAPVDEPLPPLRPVAPLPGSELSVASLSLAPTITQETTEKGELFSVDGNTQFVHYRPLQPVVGVDVTSATGEIARSAFITSLTTQDVRVEDMSFARPVIDLGELEPEIETDEVVFPTNFTNISTYRIPSDSGAFEERQQLNVIVGQFSSGAGDPGGNQRLFTDLEVEVIYEPAQTFTTAAIGSTDSTRPRFNSVRADVVSDGLVGFRVEASDLDDAGNPGDVARVAILYRSEFDGATGVGTWTLQNLVNSGGGIWTGTGSFDPGPGTGEVQYFVQAVDARGNGANSSFKGLFYEAEELPPVAPPPSPDDGGGTGETPELGVTLVVDDQEVPRDTWITEDPVLVTVTGLVPGTRYRYSVDGGPLAILPESGQFEVRGEGAHIVTVQAAETGQELRFPVLIDTSAPQITITSPPDGAFFETGDDPVADYRCDDAASGTSACQGFVTDLHSGSTADTTTCGGTGTPVADGAPLPVAVAGERLFTVLGEDNAGNPCGSLRHSLQVVEPLAVSSPIEPTAVGELVEINGTFTDLPSFIEQITIDWGDGTSDTLEPSDGSFVATHAYAAAEVYQAAVQLQFIKGGLPRFTQNANADFIVIYDPAAGFVTGGGWIESPSGAYTPDDASDADVTGKANFGFVSRYRRGRTTPDGNATFRFRAANIDFRTRDLEWMVITGARIRMRGTGEFKERPGSFQFQITALDADINPGDAHTADAFRIRIWNETDGVIYDNALGADDSEGDGGTTELGGGSIVIHD